MATKSRNTLTDEDLIARYIVPHPTKMGVDQAVIAGYGVSVWALVGYLRGTDATAERVAADYDLPVEAVEAAMAYYRQHKALFDSRIAVNDAAFA
ncbi:MAG: DUF433 domain-containing protein [Thermomicrobiales bacterium]